MTQETIRTGTLGLAGLVLSMGILFSGLMAAPSTADAFWWPWWKSAYAQESEQATSTVVVTIQKYIDESAATDENADGLSFPMNASWSDPEDGAGGGLFALASGNSYQAVTNELAVGADYSTNEVLDGDTVGASCSEEKPFALTGYTTGSTLEAAAAGTPTTTAPAFTDLSDDAYVIVWNETCDTATSTPSGELVGEVTGGSDEENPGELAVTSIDAEKTTAVANGTFEDGWRYVFNITVPSDEDDLSMKFNDWLHTNGSSTIPVANNMRISSAQASSTATVLLTAEDTYSSPALTMADDLDPTEDGIQVEVLVEVAVPAGTLNGTYSTDYGVRSE